MIIKVDIRESELLVKMNSLIETVNSFKNIIIKTETLSVGDIIICDDKETNIEEKLIIERKSIADLLSSIKDGRYEEQSYRLNGLSHHNHNIIYLIEGDVNKNTYFKSRTDAEKQMAYSAMFSLNYYKGFSVFRSFSLEETATIVCNMAYKLEKQKLSGKNEYYKNNMKSIDETLEEKVNIEETDIVEKSVKNYVNVIKKVKKDNITPDNIDEIMLCQIPGVS